MFAGSMAALVTPMDRDGALDYAALAALIAFHVEAGTDALVIAGTTGEAPTLDHAEHIELLERSCEIAAGGAWNGTASAKRSSLGSRMRITLGPVGPSSQRMLTAPNGEAKETRAKCWPMLV